MILTLIDIILDDLFPFVHLFTPHFTFEKPNLNITYCKGNKSIFKFKMVAIYSFMNLNNNFKNIIGL